MTPHLKYAGIGYRDPERQAAFGLENPLPLVQPRSDEAPYRVIGTRYTKRADLTSKTFRDPTGSCTYCHTLTTDWTGKVLAYDSVGKVNENQPYKSFFEKIDRAKTDWAKQPGNTHPWMVPWLGPNVNPGWEASPISEGSWQRIAACINESSDEDCQYRNVYTSCPAPEHTKTDCTREDEMAGTCTRLADPFGPGDLTVETSVPGDGYALPAGFDRKSTISWVYLNGLGGVPQRDDVRFNLLVHETKIPETGRAPDPGEFPDLATASDPYHADAARRGQIHYCDLESRRTRTCHILDPDAGTYFLNNISFAGHLRNTTPPPATSPRSYRVHLPTRCNTRYLARLVPKRFCFDRSGVLGGENDHLAWFDVTCDTN